MALRTNQVMTWYVSTNQRASLKFEFENPFSGFCQKIFDSKNFEILKK